MRFSESDAARIRETASHLIDEHHLPGMAIGVVSGEELVFSEGFGYADIKSKAPMTPEHRHRIASVTKTMTALCIMALVDDGRLSLDDRLVDLMPELVLKGPADGVTVWHLLTHTSGIGEVPNPEDLRDPFQYLFCEEPPPRSLTDCYGTDGITIEVPPGTKYAYANHGFVLLGEIVERLESKPLAQVFNERIFAPLGMSDSALDDQQLPRQSTGYHRPRSEDERRMLARAGRELPVEETIDGHNVSAEFLYTWGNAGQGGAQSTIPDMARYASALLRGGGGIVRPETLALMTQDHWRPDARLPGRGLGFGLGSFGGRRSFGHTGEYIGGWHSAMTVFPDEDTAVLVHVNATFPTFEATVKGVFQAVFDQPSFVAPECRIDERVLETAARSVRGE